MLLFSSGKFSKSDRVHLSEVLEIRSAMNQQIKQKVEALVAKILGDLQSPVSSSNDSLLLGADGGFDSTKTLELIVAVEQEFGIVINDDEISPDNFGGTENLIRFISLKQRD